MMGIRRDPVRCLALVFLAAGACATDAGGPDDAARTSHAVTTGPPGTWRAALVPRGAYWVYYDGPDDQGVTWRSPSEYVPWNYGRGPLGYGESYLQTVLSYGLDPDQKPPTAYFRRSLAVDRAQVAALELNVMYDDGFVFYINGVEGGRPGMPGEVSFSMLAFGHEAENKYASFDLTSQISRFTDDYGLLAFEVHQVSRSSSDLVFDAEVVAWMNGALDVTTSDDIPRNSYWHFWDRGDLGTAWRSPTYADSAWSAGEGPLGYGESYLTTGVSAGPITTYFRKQFEIDSAVRGLRGEVMYDDGFVIYLNGREVGRASMPTGPISAATLAQDHEANAKYHSFDWTWAIPLLVPGKNTVAVEVHQVAATSSDVVFDLALEVQTAWYRIPGGGGLPDGKIWFVDGLRGWSVGAGVRRTIDGGRNWTPQSIGTTAALRAVQFVDAQHGWIVGDAGTILATRDGGQTWVRQSAGTTSPITDVSFVDASTGWIVSPEPSSDFPMPVAVYQTRDGGATWARQVTGILGEGGSYKIGFADALHGWLAGAAEQGMYGVAIHSTSDGGQTWTEQWRGSAGALMDLEVIDATTVWVVGMGSPHSYAGELKLVTRDGGATWVSMPASSNNTALDAIHFVDASRGWAVGWGGSILNTVDGGVTWNIQRVAQHDENYYSSPEPHYHDVYFADARTGWAPGTTMGVSGLFRTTSGGE